MLGELAAELPTKLARPAAFVTEPLAMLARCRRSHWASSEVLIVE